MRGEVRVRCRAQWGKILEISTVTLDIRLTGADPTRPDWSARIT